MCEMRTQFSAHILCVCVKCKRWLVLYTVRASVQVLVIAKTHLGLVGTLFTSLCAMFALCVKCVRNFPHTFVHVWNPNAYWYCILYALQYKFGSKVRPQVQSNSNTLPNIVHIQRLTTLYIKPILKPANAIRFVILRKWTGVAEFVLDTILMLKIVHIDDIRRTLNTDVGQTLWS